jgi:hypothetical protein
MSRPVGASGRTVRPGRRTGLGAGGDQRLARSWRVAGIGSAQVPSAPGFYGGLDVAIVTVDFGQRTG